MARVSYSHVDGIVFDKEDVGVRWVPRVGILGACS